MHEAWSAALRDVMEPPVSDPTVPLGTAPQPVTLDAVKEQGLKAGDVIIAPLVSGTGFIDHLPETPVVVIVKSFMQSKTMTWLRRTVYAAFGMAFVIAFGPSVVAGSFDKFNWTETRDTFLRAFAYAMAAALFAVFKKLDNDPVRMFLMCALVGAAAV